MPAHSLNVSNTVLQYTVITANALQDLGKAAQIPFVGTVCNLTLAVVLLIQNNKSQKEQCLQMVEDIHLVLCILMGLCVNSDNLASPQLLEHIAQYAQTLQKFHACLKAQKELGNLKRLFKQGEITQQLRICKQELSTACNMFKMNYGARVAGALVESNIDTEQRHQELLELISAQTESGDTASSVRGSMLNSSSGSSSLLPSPPKIFHGRDTELSDLVVSLTTNSAHVAILGLGGMGKTTLATAALHHPVIMQKYPSQHFVSCESTYTSFELVSMLGSHLGFENSRQLSQIIVQHFRQCGPCLLVLDNFETPWEPLQSRSKVEDFLSTLTEIPDLGLLITMRGAERPGKVKWSRPFLPPLEPLSASASRQIFVEVAEEPTTAEETALDELLTLCGSLPLAVSLMANIVSFEGYTGALSRWHEENTMLLSDGHKKSSNLEKSIVLSLTGARMSSSPHARDLLSLLSLLPDGVTVKDLVACQVPIPQIGQCASSLVQTSLAYMDTSGRIKSLVPIREYIRRVHPPSVALSRPLQSHLEYFVSVWKAHKELASYHLASTIMASLGNINELILHHLSNEGTFLLDNVNSILTLDYFSAAMVRGRSPLMEKLRNMAEVSGIPWVKWKYRCRQLFLSGHGSADLITDAELWINEGLNYFSTVQCPIEEVVIFYNAASQHYSLRKDFTRATRFNDFALSLGKQTMDISQIQSLLHGRANIAQSMEDASDLLRVVKEARALGPLAWSTWFEMTWLEFETYAHLLLGNLPRVSALIERLHEQVIDLGMAAPTHLLSTLDIQTDVHLAKTEYLEAKKICDIAITKASPTYASLFHAHFLVQRAYIGIFTGSKETEILDNVDMAEAIYIGLGSQRILLCSWVKAEVELSRGILGIAYSAFENCFSKSLGVFPDITTACFAALGDPRNKLNNPWNTLRWAITYFVFVRKNKQLVATFHALRCLADVFAALDDGETAFSIFCAALEGATHIEIHRLRAECMVGIGDIMSSRDNMDEAKEMWEAAHPLFVRSSQMKAAVAVRFRLEKLSSAGVNQEDTIESAEIDHDTGATANQEESRNLEQLALFPTPPNPPSAVAEG